MRALPARCFCLSAHTIKSFAYSGVRCAVARHPQYTITHNLSRGRSGELCKVVRLRRRVQHQGRCSQRTCRCQAAKPEVAPDEEYDWAARYAPLLRAAPLAAGALGIVSTLANRLFSGIAPSLDAGSSQSRTDVLAILVSATLLLTGLQWLALKPKELPAVEPDGPTVAYVAADVPDAAAAELKWAYEALSSASRTRAVVAFHRGRCLAHLGVAAKGHEPGSEAPGPLCQQAMRSGSGNYLANLALYPGRFEFFRYLPGNMQGVAVVPIGEEGVLLVATDTQRGFSRLDQTWFATIADKLAATLESAEGSGDADMAAAGAKESKTVA